jgi:phospholipid/cholesterol/gamma-HCH transport system ATP-binding protein
VSLIELRDVHKRFDQLVVLDGLSLKVEAGESVVVIGASGSGKSVTLKLIVGLLQPDSGEVFFDGKPIHGLSQRALVPIRRQIGFLFQGGALFDSMTVEENVGFPLSEQTNKTQQEIDRLVDANLMMVGLPEVRNKMPSELSGGQRKRVALARAIAMEPRLILYDEPTTGLDPVRSDVINELILKLQRELQVTSVVVTHDMHSAFKVGNRIVMLSDGRIIFNGTPQELRDSEIPTVRRFVRGEADERELASLREAHPDGRGAAATARNPAASPRRGAGSRAT